MIDLIDRQAAIREIIGQPPEPHDPSWYAEQIKALPSAQPETAKRIVGKSRGGMTLWYQCDMCNEPVDAQDDFCRGCGRKLTDG